MAKKFSVTVDDEQIKGAQWYIDHYSDIETLQDVVRLLFGKTPDRLVEKTAGQNHRLNTQMLELADALQVKPGFSNVIGVTRKNIDEIDRLNKEVERVTELSQDWYLKYEQIEVMLNHEDFTGFNSPQFLLDSDLVETDNHVKDSVNDLLVRYNVLRKEMAQLGEFFCCPANANAIQTHAQEQLKTIATKLGVPDTVDHIVQRIEEVEKTDGDFRTKIAKTLEINVVDRDVIANAVEALQDAFNKQKEIIEELLRFFNTVKTPIFPEPQEMANAENLYNFVEHLSDLHERRKNEANYFMRMLYQPIHKLLWHRFKYFWNGLFIGRKIRNTTTELNEFDRVNLQLDEKETTNGSQE